MSQFFQHFLVVLIISGISRAKLLVDDECVSNRISCPEKSKCRPLSCRGYRCACDEGYMPADNNTKCIKGTPLGYNCNPKYPPCLNAHAVCLKNVISLSPAYCQCEKGYINAGNRECLVQTEYKRFGEWCESKCGPTLTCKLGFCQCRLGYRQRTATEIQADPTYQHDCIENEFSLTKCRGSAVLLLAGTNTNSLNEIQKASTEFNENYTDTMSTIDHGRELETWTTQYNLTSSNPDNQSSDITMPTSTETSTLPVHISLKVTPPSTPDIQTSTMATTLEMTDVSPSESSPSSDNPSITNSLTNKSTLTSPAAIKTTQQKEYLTASPTNHDTTTNRIPKSTATTKPQNSDSSPSRTRLSVRTQVPTTITNIITSSVQISQSTPTQSTERVTLPKLNTTIVQVPTSRPTTTGPRTDPQSQTTMKTTRSSLSSVPIENSTTLTTILRQSKNSTTKELPTATNASTIQVLRISEATTDAAEQNITQSPDNESDLTHAPATQTEAQPQPNSENRISTEAIVIPSVFVIVLAIVIISIIAVVVCRKRRSHLSLSTGVDNNTYKLPRPSMMSQALASAPSSLLSYGKVRSHLSLSTGVDNNTYKLPRPSMMSQALTSAPSPPTSYGTGRHPSYHYVNYAFENENF